MIDSDLKIINKNFLKRMLDALINADFVLPNYKRTRFEGNVTNHFVYPMLYLTYGKLIRQPIAGDYAFNKKFLNSISLDTLKSSKIFLEYGIDLFLLDWALKNNFRIQSFYAGIKNHSPSYEKTERIFINVFKAWKMLYKDNLVLENLAHPEKYFKSITFKGTQFINFRKTSVENNLPEFLYLFNDTAAIDPWTQKINVHADNLCIRTSEIEPEIKQVCFVKCINIQKLIVKNATTFGNQFKLYQNLSMHIRGAAATLHDKDGFQIGYSKSLETKKTDNNKRKIIEKINNLENFTSLTGKINDIMNYVDKEM